MPIYEYECQACHHHMETLQKMSEAPLTTCPECRKDNLQKVISSTSFQLKGTGWYVTDFKNKNASDKGTTGTSSGSTSGSSSTTTTSSTEAKKS